MYAKHCGGFGNEKHISAHLLDFKAMSRETGYKTRHLHVGERGKEGVCFLCLCLSFWKGQRTLAASELPQESNFLFWTQQTSNPAQEHTHFNTVHPQEIQPKLYKVSLQHFIRRYVCGLNPKSSANSNSGKSDPWWSFVYYSSRTHLDLKGKQFVTLSQKADSLLL